MSSMTGGERMTPERMERVKVAFTKVADADPAARQRLIHRLEQDDPVAAQQLQDLLRAHDDADSHPFEEPLIRLDTVTTGSPANEPAYPSFGANYRVIRLLGCGSSGDVYLAEEAEPVSRKVAIKVFRPHTLDETRMRRFGVEARALATLSHPGIAQVYGAGESDDGRPYLAMEFVPGKPIDRACETAGLDKRECLQLFRDLCDAVHHAHQGGIIHRDLKPSNILATESKGGLNVKIIDFGVAKLADETGASSDTLTLQGHILGTIDYMSPEQWRGERADTRTDIYSLGVILYRMLTGRMPFGDGVKELAYHSSPEPIPELPAGMRRDIETIIAKALSLDPADRYASPLHMAEDVSRVLNGQTIFARRTTMGERAIKLARRRPRTTMLFGLLAIGGMILIGMTATSRQQLAVEVDMQRSMIVGLLDDVLSRLYVLTGSMESREALAQSLLERTDELLLARPDDPSLLEARARLHMELGNIDHEQMRQGYGESHFEMSVRSLATLADSPGAGVETKRRHADALVRYSYAVYRRDTEAGVAHHQQAHAIIERLAQQNPDHPGVLDDLCWSLDRASNFGGPTEWANEEGNLTICTRRLDLAHKLLALEPDRVLSHFNLMKAHLDLASHHHRYWNPDLLSDHLTEATTYGERIIAAEPSRFHYRLHFLSLLLLEAQGAMQRGDHEVAGAVFDRLDTESAQLFRDNPGKLSAGRARVTSLIEHAHAARSFESEERIRQLSADAREMAEQHPRYVLGRSHQLLAQLNSEHQEHGTTGMEHSEP